MANRPKGFGLTAEVQRKIEKKYDLDLEADVINWIEAVLGNDIWMEAKPQGINATQAALKDGQILCKLINAIRPGSVKKINTNKMAFKQMENIATFLEAADLLGCSKYDMFQTVDLYEKTNMVQVINGIVALSRMARKKGYSGPSIGPKEANANKRDFSDEVLKGGNTVIGLQAGTNKGASQAGMSFGKSRSILE